jgi:hypothetical protein
MEAGGKSPVTEVQKEGEYLSEEKAGSGALKV